MAINGPRYFMRLETTNIDRIFNTEFHYANEAELRACLQMLPGSETFTLHSNEIPPFTLPIILETLERNPHLIETRFPANFVLTPDQHIRLEQFKAQNRPERIRIRRELEEQRDLHLTRDTGADGIEVAKKRLIKYAGIMVIGSLGFSFLMGWGILTTTLILLTSTFIGSVSAAIRHIYLMEAASLYDSKHKINRIQNEEELAALQMGLDSKTWLDYSKSFLPQQNFLAYRHPVAFGAGIAIENNELIEIIRARQIRRV